VLTLGAIATAVLVHWLPAVFFFELAVSLFAVDRTVGMRAYVTTDIRPSGPEGPWPPSKTFWLQLLAATAGGLAVGYAGLPADHPMAVMAVLMAVVAVSVVWGIGRVASRRRRAS
jgi:hypothetical protein